MATKLERGLALLKSLACDHDDPSTEHAWRSCRVCLAVARVQDCASARAELAALLADHEHAKSTVPCAWTEDEDGNWHTGCGQVFNLCMGTPDENKLRFCPYCGKALVTKGGEK